MIPGNANPLLLASAADAAAAAVATKSLRFNDGDSAYLNRTPSSAGNRKTFTFSAWVKKTSTGSTYAMLGTGTDSLNLDALDFNGEQLRYTRSTSGSFLDVKTNAVFRDPSAWYHIVLAVDTTQSTASNRVKLYVNGVQQTSLAASNYPSQNEDTFINSTEPQVIGRRSAHQDNYFDGYMADAYLIDGSALDPTSFGAFDDNGVWQAAAYSGTFGTNGFHLLDFANEATVGHDSSGNENDFTANNLTGEVTVYSTSATITHDGAADTSYTTGVVSAMFDGSTSTNFGVVNGTSNKFVNIAFATGITVSSSLKVHAAFRNGMVWKVNGSTVSSTGVSHPNTGLQTLNFTGTMNSLRCEVANGNALEIHLIQVDGSALVDGDPTDLDVLFDVPTNGTQSDTGAGGEVSGNYCTWNPNQPTFATTSFSNGNLDSSIRFTNGSVTPYATGTIAVSSGKWFWEITLTQESSDTEYIGIIDGSHGSGAWSFSVIGAYFSDARKAVGGSPSSYGATYTTGDVIGVALDADNGNLEFYKNGVSQGSAATGMTFESYKPFTSANGSSTAQLVSANFGQRAFAYSAPSNYKALCTTNLPTPTIADGSEYFDTVLWSGDSTSPRSITGLEFSPDIVYSRPRNYARSPIFYDSVRGAGKKLYSNLTDQEDVATGRGYLSSFDSAGFTLIDGADGDQETNSTGYNYVGWCWDAGSSTVSNTDGSGLSNVQVRANTTAGISIVTYTGGSSSPANSDSGDSFGHGLGVAPDLVICKKRTGVNSWPVYHRAAPTGALILNATNANDSSSFLFAKKDPTSTEVFLGNNPEINNSSHNYVAYCFAPVNGFSFFGEFSGNGSSDGPFLYTGHRPAWIMVKCHDTSTSSTNWIVWDTARDPINMAEIPLRVDLSNIEIAASDNYDIDILSNGFKIRTSNGGINHASRSYVFASFAENPFQANGGLAR